MIIHENAGVTSVRFSDGSTLSAAQLLHMGTNGTTGNDILQGTSGDDVFDGKGGDDTIHSLGGSDTIIYNPGYGALDVYDNYNAGQNPVLQFGAGITESDITVRLDSSLNSLVVTDGIAGDQVTLDYMVTATDFGVTSATFSDGTSLSTADLLRLSTTGTTGNDSIQGTYYSDVFDGKGGDDFFKGNAGYDTYIFKANYGELTIDNSGNGQAAGEIDVSSTTADSLWFREVGQDLEIDVMGTTNKITVQNWFADTGYQVSEIKLAGTDGSSLEIDSGVAQLVQAMATFTNANASFDPSSPSNPSITDTTVLAAVHSAWHS